MREGVEIDVGPGCGMSRHGGRIRRIAADERNRQCGAVSVEIFDGDTDIDGVSGQLEAAIGGSVVENLGIVSRPAPLEQKPSFVEQKRVVGDGAVLIVCV